MATYDQLNADIKGGSLLDDIKKDIRDWDSYWSANALYYSNQMDFLQGNQWDSGSESYFALAKIPQIVVNLTDRVTDQLIGEMIQNIPELEVVPKNMMVDQEQIDLFQDLIRTCLYNNSGVEQLKACVKHQMCGYGALQVGTRYVDFDSFQQEPFFEFVNNPNTCGWDVSSELPTKSDGDFCFKKKMITKREWDRNYPDIPFSPNGFQMTTFQSNTMGMQSRPEECCIIVEFYKKIYKTARYVRVSPTIDGSPYAEMEEKEFDDYLINYLEMVNQQRIESEMMGQVYMTPPIPKITERKKDKKYTIKCYLCREDMIIDEYDWIGKELPIVYVDGNSFYDDSGEQHIKSMFHNAEDLQKVLNYQWTFLVQFMKTSMKGKTFATPEQMKGFEKIYNNPELYHGAIPYNWVQQIGAPPKTIDAPQLRQEMLMAIQQTTQSLMDLLGRQSAVQGVNPNGAQSQPTSGVAYQMQTAQQNQGNMIQANNIWNAMRQVGIILLDIYPKLYKELEVITVYDKDFQHRQVQLNGTNPDTMQSQNEIKPIRATINVNPSASFEMQKQIERDYILQLVQASATNPQFFGLIGDQLASLSETSITPTIVRRLKTIVPPQALMADDGKDFTPPPQQPNPEMMIKQAELKMKGQELQQNMQIKQAEHQLEIAKLEQAKLEALISAQKNSVQNSTEIQKAKMELTASIINAQQKINMTKEDHAHQRHIQASKLAQEITKQSNKSSSF